MGRRGRLESAAPLARSKALPCGLLAGILALAGCLRFFMLSEIGIWGSDTLYYLTVARGWTDAPEGYRQVILGLYALVLRLGGESDWSIKALNVSLDVCNVLLAFWIARRISGRDRVALVTALSYALLPRAIVYARSELFHTAATSFLLISVAFLIGSLTTAAGTRRWALLALSGLFIGLGYGVHIDLMPFVPGMVACVLLGALDGSRERLRPLRHRVAAALAHGGAFLASAVSVMLPLGVWHTVVGFAARLGRQQAASAGGGAGGSLASIPYPELFHNMVEFNSSAPTAFVFFALAIAAVARVLWLRVLPGDGRRPGSHPALGLAGFAPAIVVFSHLLLYPHTIWYLDPRHFLAAMPLVLTSLFVWMDQGMALLPGSPARRAVLYVCAALALIGVNASSLPAPMEMRAKIRREHRLLYRLAHPPTVPDDPWEIFQPAKYPISTYRVVYEFLKDRVDEHNRLLVAPYVISSTGGTRRGFRQYFGDDAVYIEDCTGSLEAFIDEQRIRYLVFARFNLKALERTPTCWGLDERSYSVDAEAERFRAFVIEHGYRRLRTRGERFAVFALPDRRP